MVAVVFRKLCEVTKTARPQAMSRSSVYQVQECPTGRARQAIGIRQRLGVRRFDSYPPGLDEAEPVLGPAQACGDRILSEAGISASGSQRLDEVLVDNSDSQNTVGTGTWATASAAATKVGYDYRTHAGASGSTDSFAWKLRVPSAGTYEVFARCTRAPGRPQRPSTACSTVPVRHRRR